MTIVLGIIYAQDIKDSDSISTSLKKVYNVEFDLARHPLKPPDTSSPQATLQSFLDNMNRAYRLLMAAHEENQTASGVISSKSVRNIARSAVILFERAVYCLNLDEIPENLKASVGYEKALQLKEILDRIDLPAVYQIPNAQAVEREEELKKYPKTDRWRVPDTDIIIGKVTEGAREGMYLFTPQTVRHLTEYYQDVEDLPYKTNIFVTRDFLNFYITTPGHFLPPKWSEWLPEWSSRIYLSQTLWQWFALFLVMILAIFFVRSAYRWLLSDPEESAPAVHYWKKAAFTFVVILTLILMRYIFDMHIKNTGSVLITLRTLFSYVFWVILAMNVFFFTSAVSESIIASPRIDPQGIQASYIRALFGVLGFLAAAMIFVYGLSRAGVALIPLLTGVGIGGLAVALAARPTLENIIASFMIFADKPYHVGQRVRVMGQEGNVEAIGLRSTKIRLLTGPLTTIPNDKMAAAEIENIERRPYIRRTFSITLTYDTPAEKIRLAVQILKDILSVPEYPADRQRTEGAVDSGNDMTTNGTHPNQSINVPEFPPRVYFNEFNPDSLNILVNYWFHPPVYWEFLAHAHSINLQIIERFNAEHIDFAFPSQTLYLAGDEKRPFPVAEKNLGK